MTDEVEQLNGQVDRLFERLDAIACSAAGDGVRVTVNLDGRLTGLVLGPEAMRATPTDLAAAIFRLTQEAAGAALARGLAELGPVAGAEITAELTAEVMAELVERRPTALTPHPDPDDEYPVVESWALPR